MKIVFINPDNSIGIIHPTQNPSVIKRVLQQDDDGNASEIFIERFITIDEVALRDVPEGTPYHVIEDSELPDDYTFRDAWTHDGQILSVDLERAKQIHLSRIRSARIAKFEELGFPLRLDADLEKSIIPQQTRDKLQTLRNIPQKLDLSAVSSPEELRAIWPEEFKNITKGE